MRLRLIAHVHLLPHSLRGIDEPQLLSQRGIDRPQLLSQRGINNPQLMCQCGIDKLQDLSMASMSQPRSLHKTTLPSTIPLQPHTPSSGMLFPCPQCPQRCKSLSGLKRHQNSAHQNHPGLSVPVTELRRAYHPSLSGTCSILIILRSPHFSQACGAIGTVNLSYQAFHQKPQPSNSTAIGPLSGRELGLNLRNLCSPTLNFREGRSTTFLSCGLPRSFPTVTHRPSRTTEISIARSTRSRWAMSSGRVFT